MSVHMMASSYGNEKGRIGTLFPSRVGSGHTDRSVQGGIKMFISLPNKQISCFLLLFATIFISTVAKNNFQKGNNICL